MKGDFYDELAPKMEPFLKELLAPIQITRFRYDDWTIRYHFDTSERIKDTVAVEYAIEHEFDTHFDLLVPKEGCKGYILDSMTSVE